MRTHYKIIAALLVASCVQAATVVSGTVTDAAGNNITGTAIISWPSFIEPGGEMVVGGSLKSTITNGALSVTLAPNTGSTPTGTSYSVRIQSSDRKYQTTDVWVVPNTATATIGDVLSSTAPTPTAVISLSLISTAGASAGDLMSVQSGSWARLAAGAEGEVLSIVSGVPAWAVAAASGTSINVEENNAEVIAAADLTGIDFLGADFDVTDDSNEANVAIAAGLTRDAEWDTIGEIEGVTGYDFSDAANLTGDFAAARMSTNWGAAGTDACATSGGVMFDNATTVGCDADFVFNGDKAILGTGATKGLWFGDGDSGFSEGSSNSIGLYSNGQQNATVNTFGVTSTVSGGWALLRVGTSAASPAYSFWSDMNDGMWKVGTDEIGFSTGGTTKATVGGSQTVLIKDTTATTGITRDRCEDGANQGVTACRQTESFNSFDGVTFSELSTHANGTYAYCTDCTKATPCASGGSGAFAKKINGAWDCD